MTEQTIEKGLRQMTVADWIERLSSLPEQAQRLPLLVAPADYKLPAEASRIVYVPADRSIVEIGPAVVIVATGDPILLGGPAAERT